MKAKTIKYIVVIFTLLSLTACDDYLNNVPKGQKIPTTLEDFALLIADEYSNQRQCYPQALNLMNDVYAEQSGLVDAHGLLRANYMWDTSINRVLENKGEENTYYTSYRSISTANLILENIPEATECTEEERAILAAQAKILRSVNYFVLVNYYSKTYNPATASTDGGVPLITSAEVGASYTQPSVQTIYDFILNDINEALPDLPEVSRNPLYANKATGYAFAARVYLQMGEYSQALTMAGLALECNSELYDWTALYEEYADIIEDPEGFEETYSPMDVYFVENYNFCHGDISYEHYGGNISIERAAKFEEGDAQMLCHWRLTTLAEDTYYESMMFGLYNYGGFMTTETWLIEAECLAREGKVNEAMDIVNQVREKRILPDYYEPIEAGSAIEAIKKIQQVKANALIMTIVPFCDARRLNLDPQTATTLTKEVDGVTYTLAPDSYLWTMPFPLLAVSNCGNGTITQNVER